MPQLMQPVSVEMILEHKEDCPFCKSNEEEKPNPLPKSKMVADYEEDPDDFLISNNAGELERNMDDERPNDWIIDISDLVTPADATLTATASEHKVTPNPHHLIPGNEALKKSESILPWIFADKGKIENDIGYNVNNGENGVWLPSNNSMRGVAWWTGGAALAKKTKYVVRAMDKAGGHFHDRHNAPYSAFVTKILNKIADRMNGEQDSKCPFKTEEGSGKFKPPWALVKRLNGVSKRIQPWLSAGAAPNMQLYTSKLVTLYWKSKA